MSYSTVASTNNNYKITQSIRPVYTFISGGYCGYAIKDPIHLSNFPSYYTISGAYGIPGLLYINNDFGYPTILIETTMSSNFYGEKYYKRKPDNEIFR